MAEKASRKTILDYVSAYLSQTLREFAEAEREYRIQNGLIETRELEVSSDSQSNSAAPRPASK